MTPTTDVADIIRLQLRKPKSWNWQLTTSKSSPHIALPMIQLYNSKGKLLVEAQDNGKLQNSWSSTDVASSMKKEPRRVQRCRSDNLQTHLNPTTKRKGSVDRKVKSKEKPVEGSASSASAKILSHLQKSRSDVLDIKLEKARKTLEEILQKRATLPATPYKNRNGELFRKSFRSSQESLKRAIADGYSNFITSALADEPAPTTNRRNRSYGRSKTETVIQSDNHQNIDITTQKHKKYRTRTSSAGTLVISDESFRNPRHRRRHTIQEEQAENAENKQEFLTNAIKKARLRQISDPTFKSSDKLKQTLKHFPNRDNLCKEVLTRRLSKELFYSPSETCLFNEVVDESNEKNFDDNYNYIVQEPITPSSEDHSRKNSGPIALPSEHVKRTKLKRQKSLESPQKSFDSQLSGNESERLIQKRSDYAAKGRPYKGNKKDFSRFYDEEDGESELLRLVRRLSTDHVKKMGANVSRHSAKGLSGRRSQSSGSICNGKGRHSGEQKICGSLPSYLDDRENGGCNNNHHDCEKPPLDEVQRIPPLGDGAPLHWKFSDNQTVLCDQGYGSERSPEEEYPPPLPEHDNPCHRHLDPYARYPFITPESTFTVSLSKGSRGLGLSVTGGVDSSGSWPGLIRVKRLFPHQLAAACGLLNVGDILLEANGVSLTGLTNYEAVEVLRTTPNQVELKVCRPPPDVLSCVSPISEVPPPPPRREPPNTLNFSSSNYGNSPEDDCYHGEFEVTLTKIQGSLGFTLRKEDDSALGHYVRALVREPALTDGRIHAGDKIIAVNDIEISSMTHEQAVQFLRQCGDVVRLRLYRDSAQTPVAALSPTETTPRTSFSRKAHLRQEAVDMLNDIAVRKLLPGNQDSIHRSLSPGSSPRRLRRQPCPSDASHIDVSTRSSLGEEQFHEGLLQKCSLNFDDESFNSLFSDEYDKPSRPSSLDLYNPNRTPVAARKPKFNFSLAHNAYELNNLDPEVLDAPNLTYTLGNEDVASTEVECGDSFPQEPASMPHIPSDGVGFSYKNPAYQSAHPQCGMESVEDRVPRNADDSNMKKWKGVVFGTEEEKRMEAETTAFPNNQEEILAIELTRGWNSRLGFSLQGAAGYTYVSAVHPNSVAEKDGRIKPGDRLIKVNDDSVESMPTTDIIDLLRIVRGPVCILVSRTKSKDCKKSNAAN